MVPGLHRNGSNGIVWPEQRHVAIGNVNPLTASVVTVDVRTGKLVNGGERLFVPLSRTGLRAVGTNVRGGYAIDVVKRNGHRLRRLVTVRPCPDVLDETIQWFPDGKSLVYEIRCQASTP